MSVTRQELDDFREFVEVKIQDGTAGSLSECLRQWSDQLEYEEDVAAIREAQADVAAGRTKPAAQVEAEIREEFGLRTRQPVS